MTRRRKLFGGNLRSLLGWRDAEADVREEMRLHVELRTTELQARGLSSEEARRAAEREVGSLAVVQDQVRDLATRTDRASAWRQHLEELAADVKHAVRVFAAAPGFSIVAVLTIAVGLGANAAIFALVNTLFFRPLPLDPENNLVRVREYRRTADGGRLPVDASRRTADRVAARTDLFSTSVPIVSTNLALLMGEGPVHVQGTRVTAGYTRILRITPILGRTFTVEEERSAAPVALISHRLWRSVFGERADIIGTRLSLEDGPLEVVGVLPPAFHVPYGADLWYPTRIGDEERQVFILARIAPGVSMDQVLSELEAEGRRLNEAYPDLMRGMGVMAVRARDFFASDDDRVALVLMGAVGVLLLIGCANVALLLTTRFAARQREVAIRAALGCGRGRQVRQFITEALLLFGAGGVLGTAVALSLKDSLVAFLPETIALEVGIQGVPIDLRVLLFAGALSLMTGLAFGLLAALRATRADLQRVLRDAGRSVAGGSSRRTLRGLAVLEVALALVLLASAWTLADTFRRVQQRDLGFEPNGVLTMQGWTEGRRFADGSARLAYVRSILDRIRQMPGVQSAAVTTVNPLCCGDWGARASVEGRPATTADQLPIFQHQLVSDGFFETMRIPILRGRSFNADDRAGREMVAIVDEQAAKRFWPGEDPIGRRVKRGLAGGPEPWLTVVGVAGTIQDQGQYADQWYLPLAQHPTGPSSRSLHLMIRSPEPMALVPSIKTVSAQIEPALPLQEVQTLDQVRDERLEQSRLGVIVTAVFATAGVLLAGLGLYGVLTFVLAGDTREIAVRLALGATRASVARLVVRRALGLTVLGLVAGAVITIPAGLGLQRIIEDASLQPGLTAAAAGVVLFASLAAAAVPVLRAARLDPLEALRAD